MTLANDYLTYSFTFFVEKFTSLLILLVNYIFFFLSWETFFKLMQWRSAKLDFGDVRILFIIYLELNIAEGYELDADPTEVLRLEVLLDWGIEFFESDLLLVEMVSSLLILGCFLISDFLKIIPLEMTFPKEGFYFFFESPRSLFFVSILCFCWSLTII